MVDLFRLAKRMDIAVIVSGDGDFAPAIRALQDEGVRCEVISFRPNTSSDLIAVADEFIDIMKIASIGRGDKKTAAAKVMSAPEMPAKEVVPEFGFREASPSVAAAALAALREGKEPRATTRGSWSRPHPHFRRGGGSAGRHRQRERHRRGAATAEGEESRRRRRRRGGRGRGRGRHPEDTAATPEPTGEIGWVELDDISQLEELDSAPLTDDPARSANTPSRRPMRPRWPSSACWTAVPTRADAAAGDVAVETKPARAAEAESPSLLRRRRRRQGRSWGQRAGRARPPLRRLRRRPTPRGQAGAADAIHEADQRHPSKSKATKASTEPAATEDEAAARRRRKSAKSSAAATADASPSPEAPRERDGEDQSQEIWQRFRSARGGTSS